MKHVIWMLFKFNLHLQVWTKLSLNIFKIASAMLCCGVCGKMSKRDYKVATTDGMELEPLGGPATDKDNLTNGLKCG